MNYLTYQRRNALAAQYVLGTLQGKARKRFQRLLMQHLAMRETLWHWENHLNALGGALPAREPSPQLWQKIEIRLGFQPLTNAANRTANNIAPSAQQTAARWQWLTALSAAAIMFAVLLASPQLLFPTGSPRAPLAVVLSETAQALWVIDVSGERIRAQATAKLQPHQDNDYELWIVAKNGDPPISLGLLPRWGQTLLARADILKKVAVATLAVSLEPRGGSPNGKPTRVLYTADLIAI